MSVHSKCTDGKLALNVLFASPSQSSANTMSIPAARKPQLAPPHPEKKSKTLTGLLYSTLTSILKEATDPGGKSVTVLRFTLPDDEYLPAVALQRVDIFSVALSVSG